MAGAPGEQAVPGFELVISTYNNPRSLALCLDSLRQQKVLPQSVAFADDGSGAETAAVIDGFRLPGVTVRHVWHPDDGFRKCEILNKAIASSTADYLVLIDGDILMHPGFLQRHLTLARPGQYLTGSLIRLNADATSRVTPDLVRDGTVFRQDWLRRNGALGSLSAWLKSSPLPLPVMGLMDRLSPVRPSLSGANASAFRADLLRVGGYDERMKYGGEDKELGERLQNAGIRGRHLRYTAPAVHLDHPRGYANPEDRARNRALLAQTRRDRLTHTDFGIGRPAA